MEPGYPDAVPPNGFSGRRGPTFGVAETLRGIAAQLRYDLRCADQLRALADGFERFASRLTQEADAGTQ
jgi:hypothetical protein